MRTLMNWIARPVLWRRAMITLFMVGATVAAFYWGRMGGSGRVDAQQVQLRPNATSVSGTPSDYSRRVVAYIYKDTPITREELGEYLIARFGAQRLDFLINRRIVELECQAKGIYVTEQEVDTQFLEDLRGLGGAGMTAQDFSSQVLKRFNKTLFEWKEDVIRPRLLLSKLCRPMVEVTQKDLIEAFEARYGPKVQCRMIAFAKNDPHASEVWTKINGNEAEFEKQAKMQFIPALASQGGVIPPMHKHFGDAKVEEAAFNLRPGEITALLEMKDDGTRIVLKCDKHLLADSTVTFESKRAELYNEMKETKLAEKIKEYFAELRTKASPNILITHATRQEDLVSQVQQELGAPRPVQAPRPTAPSGN